MLVLIPKSIDGQPLDLKLFLELVEKKSPKEGHATKCRYIWDKIIKEHSNQAATQSHWVLMTKDVIEGSRNKSYPDQQALVAKFANCEVPNLLDAIISILTHALQNEERLFTDNDLLTYTRVQEQAQDYQIVVGGFSPAGLFVYCYSVDNNFVGVAALWKFF